MIAGSVFVAALKKNKSAFTVEVHELPDRRSNGRKRLKYRVSEALRLLAAVRLGTKRDSESV